MFGQPLIFSAIIKQFHLPLRQRANPLKLRLDMPLILIIIGSDTWQECWAGGFLSKSASTLNFLPCALSKNEQGFSLLA